MLLAEQVSARNIAVRVIGALAGLTVAFMAARWTLAVTTGDRTVDVGRMVAELGLFLAFATLALMITSAIPIRNDLIQIRALIHDNEAELRERNRGQRFLRRVQTAFEMAEREDELFAISGVAMAEASAGPAEILVADSSNAHVGRVSTATGHDAPACGVVTPHSCPAVRNGTTMKFGSPNGLASCPRLRDRGLDDQIAALCIPVNVLGTPSAVLHALRDRSEATADELDRAANALEGVAVRFGARLGMMRAMSQSRLQADTDPLTGLLNRRAMENKVRELRAEGSRFALAMADLDHFKHLNDTYGHDTGDRALRLFARVMNDAMRDSDIVSRHGGEEFVIVLPDADVTTAAPVLHRIRTMLADAISSAQVPAFTVSIGLVDSTWSDELHSLLRSADRALREAKDQGRDRVIIDHARDHEDQEIDQEVDRDVEHGNDRGTESAASPAAAPEPTAR